MKYRFSPRRAAVSRLISSIKNSLEQNCAAFALFRNRYPDARIAIVADHYRLNELTLAYRAGANGYFVDIVTCDRFIRSIELVMMGEMIFPPGFLSFILDANRRHPLEAAASVRNGEPVLVATKDATLAPAFSAGECDYALHHRRRL